MNDTRPVNLDLATVKFPITAIASITHRVCAVISWVGIAALLMVLCSALNSADDYSRTIGLLSSNFLVKFCVWGFLSAFAYYCFATAKHIVQDFGFFEDLAGGVMISWLSLGLGGIFTLLAGVLVWG